jgi:hypothetical protein
VSITPIPDELRTAVIELHGSECLRCGVQCTWSGPTKLHIDHVIPEIDGGPTTLANLQVLCRGCNLNKGADTADYRTAKARDELAQAKKLAKKRWKRHIRQCKEQEAKEKAERKAILARAALLPAHLGRQPIGEYEGWVISWKPGERWVCTCGNQGDDIYDATPKKWDARVFHHLMLSPRHRDSQAPAWGRTRTAAALYALGLTRL